jgi:hypothetical protein
MGERQVFVAEVVSGMVKPKFHQRSYASLLHPPNLERCGDRGSPGACGIVWLSWIGTSLHPRIANE